MPRTFLMMAIVLAVPFAARISAAEAPGSTDSLTAERVVALARSRAPQVRAAESRVLEARGRLAGARAPGQENPTLEGVASTDDRFERRTQWELQVPIGIGLGWVARTGMAKAELERERRLVDDARRGAVGAALAAYYRVLHAARRVELAKERRSVADELHRTAVERNRSGQVARLEVLVTETEAIRADSDLLTEEQAVMRARIALASMLGLSWGEGVAVAGDLGDRSLLTQTLASSAPVQRADVMAADRELRAARAAKGLARSELLPGLAFRLDYGHEGGDPLVQPGLAVTVPLFQHGQDSRRIARAREMRAIAELERARSTATAEVEGLETIYEAATRAAEQLGSRALPHVEESEGMVRESYRAGKIDLPALLVVRRDLLETRKEYLDRLLDAALAAIDLAVARGHFQ
jgi:cobalt-zinc-cadmium efflux system outer membrane protein